MKRDLKIVSSPWFILALATLLLNDFLLKDLYGNWLTGKLSDFAGLFVFSLFWCALFPKCKLQSVVLTGLVFVWWKSPLSQPFIDLWNIYAPLQIGRVVDFSDLLALAVLPIAFLYSESKPTARCLRVSPLIPLVASCFAFMATSTRSTIEVNKMYVLDMDKSTLEKRLNTLDSLDSLKFGYGIRLPAENPVEIELEVPSDLCFDSFSAKVTVAELSNGKMILILAEVRQSCSADDEDKQKATLDFEKAVIDKLKVNTR